MAEALIATAVPRLLASVRRQATPSTIAGLIRGSGVWDLMKSRNIESTGHNVVVYWDEPGRDLMHSPGGIPVDIGAEITAPFEDDSELHCTKTRRPLHLDAAYRRLFRPRRRLCGDRCLLPQRRPQNRGPLLGILRPLERRSRKTRNHGLLHAG